LATARLARELHHPRTEAIMKVRDIMTQNPACCTPETSVREAARLMVVHDCGEIPVLDAGGMPIGVITDRDIVCRAVANGTNPIELCVADCMTTPCVTVGDEMRVSECCDVLERHQIRRAPVVDASGRVCGIVSQADIARSTAKRQAGELVRAVSQPRMSSAHA
jgi:CBS domain-containing protein